eukprot:2182415-Pleurochrysis_carterae.AAC.1
MADRRVLQRSGNMLLSESGNGREWLGGGGGERVQKWIGEGEQGERKLASAAGVGLCDYMMGSLCAKQVLVI